MICNTHGFAVSRWLLLTAVLVLAAGCGERRDSAPVSGRVTLNGEPQEGIFLYFSPDLPPDVDPMKGVSKSYARTDADGRYTVNFMDADKDRPGALIGNHTITADDERTFNDPRVKSRVPRGWEATFEVPREGTDELNFELNEQ